MDQKVEAFFGNTLGVIYTTCDTYVIPQVELDNIRPPKNYPNPHLDNIKDHLAKILELLELSKKCRGENNPDKCPFFKTKRLEELLNRVLYPKRKTKLNDNNIKRINQKLEIISNSFTSENVPCFIRDDEDFFCYHDCQRLIDEFRISNFGKFRFEFETDELSKPIQVKTRGLYLNRDHGDYRKDSVLISEDIINDKNEFELTFVHEHTHAMLHTVLGDVISKNKGLNEGFAVAMEYFYAKDYGLKFNEKRYGEYLAHQILTVLDDPKNPRDLFDKLKKKY